MYVGKKLRLLRTALDLTQEAMANELGISRQHYLSVETGKKEISKNLLSKINHKWGVREVYFQGTGEFSLEALRGVIQGGNEGGNEINVKESEKDQISKRGIEISNKLGDNKGADFGKMLEIIAKEKFKEEFFGDNKAEYYYRHSQSKISIILNNSIRDLKNIYEDYVKLCEISINLGSPDFMIDKFPPSDIQFKDYIKEINTDLKDEFDELFDKKLITCFKIVEYEELTKNFQDSLSKLIQYMGMYWDLYRKPE